MNTASKGLTLKDLGGALRSARQRRKLTQRALASRMNFQQAQIARAEQGADIRLSTLIDLARALGLELKLIPQHLGPTIDALIRNETSQEERPLYALDEGQ